MLRELREREVGIVTEVDVERIGQGLVVVRDKEGNISELSCDVVVLARDPIPERKLLKELEGLDVIPIGDCVRPGRIVDAVRDGYIAGRKL